MIKWRGQRSTGGTASHQRGAPCEKIVPESRERRRVGFSSRANHHVPLPHRPSGQKLSAPEFSKSAPQTIAGHRGGLELRNDQSHPWLARLVVRPQHIEMLEPPPPSPLLHPAQVCRKGKPALVRPALSYRQRPPCFVGSEMVKRFRPFLRRRESTSRPQRSAIRARNPCRLTRLRLRGRYVGCIRIPKPQVSPES